MALAVDSEMPSAVGADSAGGASLTYAFTNTAGTLLVVDACVGDSGTNTIAEVKYNGVSLTKKTNIGSGSGNVQTDTSLWYLENPATGANNVVVTTTNAMGGLGIITSGAISFTGYKVADPIRATAFSARGSSATAAIAVTGTTSGNIIVDAVATGDNVTSSTQTLSWKKNVNTNTAGNNGAGSRAVGTGGTVTMQYTVGNDNWGIAAIEVQAAAGGETITMDKWSNRSSELIAKRITSVVASGTMSIKN